MILLTLAGQQAHYDERGSMRARARARVCVCVCARARASVCVCEINCMGRDKQTDGQADNETKDRTVMLKLISR